MNELDRYLDDLTSTLLAARRPRRRPRAAFGAFGAFAAVAGAFAVLLLPSGGDRTVDALAAARSALSPDGEVLHIRVRYALDPASQITPTGRVLRTKELWISQRPSRWRAVQELANGDRIEQAYADSVLRVADSATGKVTEERGLRDADPGARAPSLFGDRAGARTLDVGQMLSSAEFEDRGERKNASGRVVRRLVSRDGDKPVKSITYDVDPSTFHPIGGAVRYFAPNDRTRPAATINFAVEVYERLPATGQGADQLTVKPSP